MTAKELQWIDGIVLDQRAIEKRHAAKIEALEATLRAFIAWTAQSAVSPISVVEAKSLLAMLK